MGRPKGDQKYWDEVIIIEKNKKWTCKYCQLTFSGGFSRIKAHLDKTQGKGISKCSVYHDNDRVQHIITSTSIDQQVAINTLDPSQLAEDPHEMINGGSIDHQNNTQSMGLLEDRDLSSFQIELNELVSDLTREEDDIISHLQCLDSHCKKRKRRVDTWLNELQSLKKRAIDMNNSLSQFWSTNFYVMENGEMHLTLESHLEILQLTLKMRYHVEEKPLVLSNEFVGQEFEENVKKMWKLLEDDRVLIIGIHGMGGVGKTFLSTYMENDIKRKGTFKHVYWVTVSQDLTIFKLQHDIAETIGLKLDSDYERSRATILKSELGKIEKAVLILDDVWKYIDLEKVGLPLKLNGIKLIITTRLKDLCQQMDCLPHNMIQMYPFRPDQKSSRELFLLKLGHHGTPATLPPPVLEIARSVVMKCYGLPLGISVLARTMKGRDYIVWWRRALDQFDNLEIGQEMKEEVLGVLKRSYDNLIDRDLQKCFLHCALLPDCMFKKEDLVKKLIESGVLNGKRSLREIFDEGHVIVDKLIDHSLLFLDEDDDTVEMNGLVRMMAWHILKQSHSYVMVKCNDNLIKIPHLREWTVDLEAASLAHNHIQDIPEETSPNCPRLSILILSYNYISHIPECLFTLMNALTLLDLSHNLGFTCLPNSVSNLTSLTSLVLRGCSELEYIPPLGALQALSTLDISHCSIDQVPEGLQNLINLKWLDLSFQYKRPGYSRLKTVSLPGGVLSGLRNMQYLDLRGCSDVKVEDVKGMSMLECFAGSFLDPDNYCHFVRAIQHTGYGPETYLVRVGEFEKLIVLFDRSPLYSEFKHRSVQFGDCEELSYSLPRDLGELFVNCNNHWVCLCSALSYNGFLSLRNISISHCEKVESLFCLSSSCSLCKSLQNVESLMLSYLDSLTAICKQDVTGFTQSLSMSGVFSHVMRFEIEGCNRIEKLLTQGLVLQLQNLQSITVRSCKSMKEIFGESNSGDDDSSIITLPNLTKLELVDLPQLTTVCKGTLVCGYEYILLNCSFECPNLKNIPKIQVKCD